MPAPSQLAIATQAVNRLVKEDKYYEKEVSTQEAEIEKLEADLPEATKTDENAEFMLRQVVSFLFSSPYLHVHPRTLSVELSLCFSPI